MKKFNPARLAKVFFLLFLISVFFPIRYVFPTSSSFATGLYSDFTSISLYLSDIFLIIAFVFTLWSNKFGLFKGILYKNYSLITLFIWLILATFILSKSISCLNIWYFFKFIELGVVSYGTVQFIINEGKIANRNLFLLIFVCLGTLQSIIGLMQFIYQSPIGLNAVGEQIIAPGLWGVAKIACPVACQFIGSATGVSGGTEYIRAYGTFPHPNLLSAFLVSTILINIYLLSSTTWLALTKSTTNKPENNNMLSRTTIIWLNLALFINIFGIIATFSRGAFLSLGIGLLTYFGFLTIKQRIRTNIWAITKVLFTICIAFLIFKPFLLTRATVSDQATIERGIYNQTALNIIKDNPFTGIGIGESLLHMKQYSPVPLNTWQIQPIHNYFLLSAAELGIIGALILIWIFLSHLKAIVYKLKSNFDPYYLLLTTLLLTFLVLMMFDHYFYTLQQTQMLLWIVLGLIAAEFQLRPQTANVSGFDGQFKNPISHASTDKSDEV